MTRDGVDSNRVRNCLRQRGKKKKASQDETENRTPRLDPRYAPTADNGAEMPNQRSIMRSIVPRNACIMDDTIKDTK